MPKNEELQPVPAPLWSGFIKGQEDNLLPRMIDQIRSASADQLYRLRNNIATRKRRIAEFAESMAEQRREMAKEEAELRQKEADAESFEAIEASLRADIEYIKTLPGVLGMRVEHGRLIVHVRTSSVYEGKLYDMGDFEITVAPSGQSYSYNEVLDLYCTRVGTRKNPNGGYYEHPYFHHNSVRADGTATGWFCFGNRADQIKRLLNRGAYGEMMHLAINSMNSVTEGSENYYEMYFTEVAFPKKEELKRRAVLRRSNPRRAKLP
jgi:hypothetical protein